MELWMKTIYNNIDGKEKRKKSLNKLINSRVEWHPHAI